MLFPCLYFVCHKSIQTKKKVMKDLGESVFTLNILILEYNDEI